MKGSPGNDVDLEPRFGAMATLLRKLGATLSTRQNGEKYAFPLGKPEL
jgi:hypothetical protein